jgi:hypothetical protein
MMNEVDPTFRAHATMTRLVGEMVLRLSSEAKLAVDIRELSSTLEEGFNELNAVLSDPDMPPLPSIGLYSIYITCWHKRNIFQVPLLTALAISA